MRTDYVKVTAVCQNLAPWVWSATGRAIFPETAAKRLSRERQCRQGRSFEAKVNCRFGRAVTCSSGKTTRKDFKRTNRFAEARIQIEMAFVQRIPKGLVFQILATRPGSCGRFWRIRHSKSLTQVTQYRRLVNELENVAKEGRGSRNRRSWRHGWLRGPRKFPASKGAALGTSPKCLAWRCKVERSISQGL